MVKVQTYIYIQIIRTAMVINYPYNGCRSFAPATPPCQSSPVVKLHCVATCAMHGVQHIVQRACDAMNDALAPCKCIKSMSSLAHLLGMGNYYLRCILAVSDVVDSMLEVSFTAPRADDIQHRLDLVDYYSHGWARRRRTRHLRSRPGHTSREQFRDEWLRVFNSNPFGHALVHHCNAGCCMSKAHSKSKAVRALRTFLFGQRCIAPSMSEWTSVGPSLLWHAFGACNNGVLNLILERAISMDGKRAAGHGAPAGSSLSSDLPMSLALVPSHTVELPGAAAAAPSDAHLLAGGEVEWKKLAGARIANVKRDILQLPYIPRQLIFATTIKVVEDVSHWLHQARCPRSSVLMDMVWEHRSPFVVACQYLSGILAGDVSLPPVRLFKEALRTEHWLGASARQPIWASTRQVLIAAHAGLYLRSSYYRRWPWRLAAAVDSRRSAEDRSATKDAFLRLPPTSPELDPGFGSPLRHAFEDELGRGVFDGIERGGFWWKCLALWAGLLDLQTQDIEAMHGQLRQGLACARSAAGQVVWSTLASRCVLKQVLAASGAAARALHDLVPALGAGATAPRRAAKTVKSPLLYFFNYCRSRDSALGFSTNYSIHSIRLFFT